MGGAIESAGVERGDRVALFLENSPAFVTAYLGAHLIGAIVVLVNTLYRQTELRHILTDLEAKVVLVADQRTPIWCGRRMRLARSSSHPTWRWQTQGRPPTGRSRLRRVIWR